MNDLNSERCFLDSEEYGILYLCEEANLFDEIDYVLAENQSYPLSKIDYDIEKITNTMRDVKCHEECEINSTIGFYGNV